MYSDKDSEEYDESPEVTHTTESIRAAKER